MKSAVTVILLVFVAASVVYLVVGGHDRAQGVTGEAVRSRPSPGEDSPGSDAEPEATQAAKPGTADSTAGATTAAPAPAAESREAETGGRNVIAYYFHRSQRCRTCLAMEAYAEQALTEGLADAMESESLQWRAVNVDEPENEHFVNEYELYASALVMVEEQGGRVVRSKKLEQIWDLVGDEELFKTFVRDEALAYLEDVP